MMSNILQITGAVAITAGAILVSLPVGLIVAGVFILLIGLALGR
jgi:hypothetical protein